jgi:pimeloyl-ACP methyl ester carboxylesterase
MRYLGGRRIVCAFTLSALAVGGTADAQEIAGGRWRGAASRQGAALPLQLSFHRVGASVNGAISIPTLGARDIPLKNVTQGGSGLHFDLMTDEGTFRFEGSISDDTLVGVWNLFGVESHVRATRTNDESLPYRTEEVNCRNGSVTLAGTLVLPRHAQKHAAVVFVHGSGPGPRQVFNFWADHFARMGLVSLAFDKRGSGASTGNWREADFSDLADDVLACVDVLKARSDIDASRIGLFGQSQGGWVAPLAASRSRSPGIAWLVLISGTPATPARQAWWESESRLRKRRIDDDDIGRAHAFWQLNDEVTRTGQRFTELQAAADAARGSTWLAALGFPPTPPPADAPVRQFLRRFLDYDAGPVLRTLTVPSLWIYGAKDETVPAVESIAQLKTLKTDSQHITVRTFPDATHSLWVAPRGERFHWMSLAPGYVDTVTRWVGQRVAVAVHR